MQQLSGDRQESLELGFVSGLELLVEGSQVGIEAGRAQSGHVKGLAEIAVAMAAALSVSD